MERRWLAQLFDHIIDGYDIPAPESMLKVKAERASKKLNGAPYSMLTNLAHANLWQQIWLDRIIGTKRVGMDDWRNDFRVPDRSEWESLRRAFLDGLAEARRISESEPFVHGCKDDAEAIDRLLRIALHGAYHCGQLNLLKIMTSTKKPPAE